MGDSTGQRCVIDHLCCSRPLTGDLFVLSMAPQSSLIALLSQLTQKPALKMLARCVASFLELKTSLNQFRQALLTKNVTCIAINRVSADSPHDAPFLGLFDVRQLKGSEHF